MPDPSTAAPGKLPPFSPPYAPDDGPLLSRLLKEVVLSAEAEARIDKTAVRLIEAIRHDAGPIGGLEDFLRDYGLSTKEGLALMVLAEALLRVPDTATQDKLIEDKIGEGHWDEHESHADTWFVSAAAWGLGLSTRIVQPGETPTGILKGLVKRLGLPAVRTATKQAMRFLGHSFVLGQTIGEALKRGRSSVAKGYRYSFDMLGEGARTRADADRYFNSYAEAIDAIGRTAGDKPLPDRPGISVKLSALHPRYEAVNRRRVLEELCPTLLELARKAKSHGLNFTVDAEEADRLELSLDVIERVVSDPSLEGWDGFGLAVQAYQKRAIDVVEWIDALSNALGRKMTVRLVKGAYWDTEIKVAQEQGAPDYPVFTRKPATDVSFLACARRLLAARPRIYSQFASHNALTVATILEMAGDRTGFEFQRLHGMGEALYKSLTETEGVPCRIYAPVGGHRDLLAYLVRRLLENGANSSFISVVGDKSVPVAELLERPESKFNDGLNARHPRIPLPVDLYGAKRRNSRGVVFGSRSELDALVAGVAKTTFPAVEAASILDGKPLAGGPPQDTISPVDGGTVAGTVVSAKPADVETAMSIAATGFRAWSMLPAEDRAVILERMGDLLEEHRDRLIAILAREAGKTLADGVAEVREAVDFCRFYAGEARRLFAAGTPMPGPTGEENVYLYRGRGVFVCISPWNFPLAIFLGQATAALAAGNVVIAKPAEQTPLVAYEAIKLLHRAGVPVDAVQLLLGDGAIGAALVEHKTVAGVAFTGSTETAWRINRALAAKNGPIVPLIAETGGLNAMIVDATALPEQVTDDVMMSAFHSAGQRCSALRLLFLQEDVADRILEMIEGAAAELTLGDPTDPATDIGPVIDSEAKAMLDVHIEDMRRTQKIRYAGEAPEGGTFVAPHIVELGAAEDLDKEVFGPILHVVRWKSQDMDSVLDAIEASGYGLTLGIHSRIDTTIDRIATRLGVGNIYVNRNMIGAVVGTQPFGGAGLSGTGPKAGGPTYLQRFAIEQVISTNTAAAGGNASLIAMGDDD
jgi:RHH-type transcriptional regulator, proline utilization regulon repressor / proline dehydrogenase / delta 1-pyrroline-5-carboxylate dehydrogenase